MRCVVKVKKSQLDRFRLVARNTYPNEVLAYLIGDILSPEEIVINSIEYTKKHAVQNTNTAQWTMAEYRRVEAKAIAKDLRVVGDIHSHPQWDAVLSGADYTSLIGMGLRVGAIVSVYKRKTRVRFWLAESSLPCEIEYL